MGHIFISYSRKDEEYVNRLVDALENEGFEVWIDRELLTGDTWTQVINHKIDTCDAVVVVMTDSSKESKWVNREVLYALQEGKKIFPLLLQGKLWMLLQDFNYFKVTDGLIPDRKFFKDIEKTVPRNEAWLKSQRVAAEKAAREKADKEFAEKTRLEAEELARQKSAKEKAELEAREKEKRESEKSEEKPVAIKPKAGGQIAYWLGGFAVVAVGIILLSSLNNPSSTPQPTPENTQTQTIATLVQDTVEPSVTITPKLTSTPVNTLTPTPLPTEITDAKGVSMALVPAGEFTMGSDNGGNDEKPVHQVYLDAFYMDIYEVTNATYKACVTAGGCSPPQKTKSHSRSSYYGNSEFDDYPVVYVDWNQAQTYCEWRGGNLPTEAQWEKAARGTDGRTYPWGEGISCNQTNFLDGNRYCVIDTTEVGSYESGKSPYGIFDMAGNVWEWVADWYDANYYANSPSSNPFEANFGQSRVMRGGSWSEYVSDVRSALRSSNSPDLIYYSIGFRCARSLP